MSKYFGTVTITRTWVNVEAEGDSEEEAEVALDKMTEDNLGPPDTEDHEVTDIEKDEDEEEEG